ncbi:MAG TPA: SpaA isopeptide-forming pilin-related protein [Thermomicrobiales bacterium]|nr:SpaA isopeptide-forming pilin-related protein [Thermomicrobiales bacterium]
MSETRSRSAMEAVSGRARFGTARRRSTRRAITMRGVGRFLHLFGAIAMLIGLFLPLTDAGRALAAPGAQNNLAQTQVQDLSTASFTEVAAIGDFQQQFGCNPFDINCPGTQLTNHEGIWTGVFPIPPGQWQWQIAAMTQDGQQVFLSESGPDQTDTVTIAETDAGVYFRFNALRQEAEAVPVASIATLATDAGTYALRPDDGTLTAIVQALQPGPVNAELQIDGVPVGNPQVITAPQGPVRVTLDASGTVIEAEDLGYGTLTITRVDGGTGQPLPGGCYEVREGGTVINRGCDTDDGVADGSILLRFPEGLEPGSYTVAEVRAPEGAEQAPDQEVDLQETDNSIQISTGEPEDEPTAEDGGILPIGEATEAPQGDDVAVTPTATTEAPAAAVPGNLIVTLQDQNNTPIGGACFQLVQGGEVKAEACDLNDAFPNNGNTGFFGVPSGTYTLHQSTAPEGVQPSPDREVQVPAGGEETVVVQAAAPAEPTPAPTGNVVVLRQDAQGNPVGGACFELLDSNGGVVGEAVCDEDGDVADDGRIGFFDVPAGSYTLHESRTPAGYNPAADAPVQVTGNEVSEVRVQGAAIPTAVPTDVPTEIPTPTPTNVPTEVPTVAPTAEPTSEATPTEAPAEDAVPGDLIVTLQNEAGQPIGGACFELVRGDETIGPVCDSDDPFPGNGNTGFFGVPSGTYTLHQTTVPDGTQPVADQEIEVPAGDRNTVIVGAPTTAQPTATPAPTVEPPGAPQDVAGATGGDVVVDIAAVDQSQGPVCVELNTSGGIGLLEAPNACNNGEGDAAPAPEEILIEDVPEGNYSIFVREGPDELVEAEPAQVSVVEGETARVAIAAEAPEPTATATPEPGVLPIVAVNAAGEPLPGACWTLTVGDAPLGPLCDDGTNGGEAGDGQVQFEGLVPGTFTLTQTQAPEGYQPVEPIPVDIAAGENAALQVPHDVVVSSIDITTTNAAGESLAGACYALDGGEPICDDGDGTVTITGVRVGNHTIAQTTAPEGYRLAAEQSVTVTAAAPASVTFQNVALTGSVSIEVVDPDGNSVPGVCYTIDGGAQQCDDDGTDANATPGTIQVDGLALGEHTVALQSVPEEFQVPAEGMTVTVEADTVTPVRFELARVAPTTGGLDVTVQLESGELVPGVCITLTSTADASVTGPFCDNVEGDTNDQAGIIGIDGVGVGAWNVSLAEDTEVPGGDVGGVEPRSVEIIAGERSSAILIVPLLPQNGTVRIVTTDGTTNLAGACYELSGPGGVMSVCDNDETTDNDGTEGVIELLDVAPGAWTATMTTAPSGYEVAVPVDLTVVAGETASVEVAVEAVPQPGSLTVTKLDGNGQALGGSCFAVQQGDATILSICDDTDANPNDGVLVFTDLAAGSYQLVETRTPSNQYQRAEAQTVEIVAGEDTAVEVRNLPRAGRLAVITVQEADPAQRLNNACYRLEGATIYGPFCDADDGTVDARTSFVNVTAGDYTLAQTVAPIGYDVAASRPVTIGAGSSLQVTVANAATPPAAEIGSLVVIPLDEHGAEVSGGCYQVLSGDTPLTGRVCDNDDDVDKRIVFPELPVGTYTVRELLAPSPDFEIAPDQEVTITLNEQTEVQFAHTLKAGRVLVQAVNTLGQPLQGACFDLANDGQDPACSAGSGEVLFEGVPAGTESLTQTQAPYGYKLNDQAREVVVSPGQTTVVRVVFETAPPPDTGSVQVQKFICPAGEEGERTQFLGGAQGNAQLAKTAGCTQGEAAFTLVAEDGSGNGPGEFSTGEDGRYQVTLKQGLYVLTEINPDLPGSSAARLRVGVGQMTTVIVINYIAPPEPVPASIEVTSYTCPPSFNGTAYGDFAESCTSDQALTNTLTVRVEGAQNYKRVTGDTGELGRTRFADLPAGKYEVYGEKPYNVPIMYLFCGTNADAPADVKTINGSAPVTLANGQTVTCHFFLVPEHLTKDTGAILVQKFSCPVDKPAKGYDWANECDRSMEQVPFSLDVFNREMQEFEPLTEVTANPDGLVRFPNLRLGTYKLEEVGSRWCFAQSNSVNAEGNVVVQPNKLAEVWIYNCVGTNQPPNTGSGDAASLLNPVDDPNTGTMVLLNFAWPAIALAAWLGWRARHQRPSPVIVRRGENRAA